MAHYAQVIDGIVQQVIVADETQIEALIPLLAGGGEWIQTSFNTRDGVHYGADGKPDGGEALRLNYAQVGGRYDAQRDVFYSPTATPAATLYYDETTHTHKSPLPNRAVERRRDKATKERKVFITHYGATMLGPIVMDNLEASLNLLFVFDPAEAEIALPLSDQETRTFAFRPEYKHCRPMTSRALWNVSDRLLQQRLNMPVLPAWRGRTPEELLEIGDRPIFVKRQRTHAKDPSEWSYTHWVNPQAFIDAVPASFWEAQQKPDETYGEFIFQPYIAPPFQDLDVRIAVNKDSETLVWSVMQMTHEAANQLGRWVPYQGDCSALLEKIKQDVKEQGLKAGIHLLQFAPYNGEWCLMDWNSRLTGSHVSLFPSVYPVLDDPFLWMLGEPLRGAAEGLYCEQRSYRAWNLGREAEVLIGECGLFARWLDNKLQRVAAIGPSKREVDARYAQLDSQLSVRFGPLPS